MRSLTGTSVAERNKISATRLLGRGNPFDGNGTRKHQDASIPPLRPNCSKGRCCNFIQISGNPFRPRLFTHLLQSLSHLPFQPPFDSSESDHPLRVFLAVSEPLSLYSPSYTPSLFHSPVTLSGSFTWSHGSFTSTESEPSYLFNFRDSPVFIFIPGTLYTWLISQQG